MSTQFELAAQVRQSKGGNAIRRLRRDTGFVPAVLYGGDAEPISLQLEHRVLAKALENEGYFTHIITVDIDGNKEKAILRGIQRHPFKREIMHVDFLRVTGKEMLTMQVPLHFIGDDASPGIQLQGGIVEHMRSDVEVKCRADNIPEFITVDISKLELNHSIHLSDLKLPKGVEMVELAHGHDQTVVAIHPPQRAEEPVAEVVEAPAGGAAPAEAAGESKGEAKD
jgi:large subunit ribosomal protein L25